MLQNGLVRGRYTFELGAKISNVAAKMGRECNPDVAEASAKVLIDHPTAPTVACIDLFLTEFAKDPPKYLRDAKGAAKDLFWFGCDAIHNAFGNFMRAVLDAEKEAQRAAAKAKLDAEQAEYQAKLAADPHYKAAEEARINALIADMVGQFEVKPEAETATFKGVGTAAKEALSQLLTPEQQAALLNPKAAKKAAQDATTTVLDLESQTPLT